ncbi:Kinesin-like protein KIN-14S [Vitis vinifera]|uniref:Kinesin-like protein n=1 Tax=Vitis vinifera TaxID=29760 RepID=A0A438KD09_VITVI|nr:Kinesin-like protein KIN-14S [Vitis vinifera]
MNTDSFPGPEVSNALQLLGIEHENLKKKYTEDSQLLKKKYLEECLERKRCLRVTKTGTGKDLYNEGTPEHRGVNYRTLEELFRISKERSNIMNYELLLACWRLEIKQAAEGTQEVPGLVEARVYGTNEVWELLKSGSRIRSVGSTNANELSSRSHCLLRVTVKGENLVNGEKTRSHLWLVDLAGSERVGRIEVEGERLKESQFINKSLSALGDVISALASKTAHIPYRHISLPLSPPPLLYELQAHSYATELSSSPGYNVPTPCTSKSGELSVVLFRKQADLTEIFKYKQLAEKLKHDEKETKNCRITCSHCN